MRQALAGLAWLSQRQLPTDLDYAVPTREYQLDQSSPLPATAAADPVLDRKKRPAHLDRSLHINVRIADNTSASLPMSAIFLFSFNRGSTSGLPVIRPQ